MRVQVILALVAALVLVAVPLYLWRRPQPANIPSADAATMSANPLMPPPGPSTADPQSPTQLVSPTAGPQVQIAPVKTLKCQDPGNSRTPPERCDGVRFFEDSLTRAIKDSVSCAPPSKSGFVVSYILEMHFGKKRTNLFMGKSTTLSKSRRRELTRCVERAMQTVDWDRIPHQHQKYTINAIATYPSIAPPEDSPPAGDAAPHGPGGSPSKAAPKGHDPHSKSKPGAPAPKKAPAKAPKKPAAPKGH